MSRSLTASDRRSLIRSLSRLTKTSSLAFFAKVARSGEDTVLGKRVRITWSSSYGRYGNITIQELPGKPFKRRLRRIEWNWQTQDSWPLYTENIVMWARFNPGMSYDLAVLAVQSAFDVAIAKMEEEGKEVETLNMRSISNPREEEVSYLKVEPADYKPIKFSGKDFGGTSEWGEFTFYDAADRDDYMAQMEGMRAFYKSKSGGAARKLFKLLKANPDILRGMDMGDFEKLLAQKKIGYRYVPTVWR